MQTTATMLPHELGCFFASSEFVKLDCSSELEKDEMLRSKSSSCSLGLIQLFFRVFLSK